MSNVLAEIIAHKRQELKPVAHPLQQSLSAPGLSIISEVKRASPAKGALANINCPAELAMKYVAAGASAVSVLTDSKYFSGSNADFSKVRAHIDAPMLRKDFIIDSRQIIESVRLGADAILLIMAALDQPTAKQLFDFATSCQLEVLVETHNKEEIDRALDLGANIIGINNRDLTTLTTNINTSLELIHCLPNDVIKVSESGIHQPNQAQQLRQAGFDAVLVGEALVTAQDPKEMIRAMRL